MEKEIVNRVANSGLINIDLEEIISKHQFSIIDMADFLWQGMILREKEFRTAVKELNANEYENHYVGLICSNEAIVPHWAYMLIANKLSEVTSKIVFGDEQLLYAAIISDYFTDHAKEYDQKRVLIKGCGTMDIGPSPYIEIQRLLMPYAKSIMYGEACSSVPVFKK